MSSSATSVTRAVDRSGDEIKTYQDSSGRHSQSMVMTDCSGVSPIRS